MDNKHGFLNQLNYETYLPAETFPGRAIIELVEDRRVLIENHLGVKAYSTEKVVVQARFGCISICGFSLEILRMTKEQLVICGEVKSISLQRRG